MTYPGNTKDALFRPVVAFLPDSIGVLDVLFFDIVADVDVSGYFYL